MAQFAYLVDLGKYQFDDTSGTWIQAMPLGKYEHPVHGAIDITPERISRFADNVNKRVRDTDLDIDYDHKKLTTEAAGWVKSAEARSDGLWLFVEWTKDALSKIKTRAYRYFSPEFVDEWTHPKGKGKFSDVLFGGALTNRPFLKDILPINLSEAFAEADTTTGGGSVDPKLIRQLLGLAEDATDEQVTEKLKTVTAPPPPQGDQDKTDEKVPVAASEGPAEEVIRRLAEQNPTIKALADGFEAQKRQLAEMQAALRLSEVEGQVVKLNEEFKGSKRALPPAFTDALKSILHKMPKQLSEELLSAVRELGKTGLVQLGEVGVARTSDATDESAVKRFNEAVANLRKSNEGMTYSDAVTAVAAMDEKLFADYRAESTAFQV